MKEVVMMIIYVIEDFYDLSSRDHDCVNQTSRIEPSCKKARTNDRALYTDSEDSEEEMSVQGTKRCVVLNVGDRNGWMLLVI